MPATPWLVCAVDLSPYRERDRSADARSHSATKSCSDWVAGPSQFVRSRRRSSVRTARPTQRAISLAVSKARIACGALLLAVLDDEDSLRRSHEDQPELPVLWWSSDLARERHRRCNHDWVGPDMHCSSTTRTQGPSLTLRSLWAVSGQYPGAGRVVLLLRDSRRPAP